MKVLEPLVDGIDFTGEMPWNEINKKLLIKGLSGEL